MKKPLLFILTLALSLAGNILFSAKTQALFTDEDGHPWWTVGELLEYKELVDNELKSTCGDDINCIRNFYQSKRYNPDDEKSMALIRLMESQFRVTAINPEQEKIKILFFDTNFRTLIMTGSTRYLKFRDIDLAWMDADFEKRNYYSSNLGTYTQEIRDNLIPNIHHIYSYNPFTRSLILPNQEIELDTSHANIAANTSGIINYTVNAHGNYNATGGVVYQDCLNDPDYAPGVECRLMFSGVMGPRYMPPKLAVEPEPVLEQKKIAKEQLVPADPSPIVPKAPDTGEYTALCSKKVVEFPWWLVTIIILGNTAFLWLFWPKNSKKYKKTIDKKEKVR